MKSVLKFIMLGVIIANNEIHGYRIHREILRISRGRWNPSIGTTYRLLNELLKDGYIDKRIVYHGRRKIIYYSATSKGFEEFTRIADSFLDKVLIGLELILSITSRRTYRGKPGVNILAEKIQRIKTLLNEKID